MSVSRGPRGTPGTTRDAVTAESLCARNVEGDAHDVIGIDRNNPHTEKSHFLLLSDPVAYCRFVAL